VDLSKSNIAGRQVAAVEETVTYLKQAQQAAADALLIIAEIDWLGAGSRDVERVIEAAFAAADFTKSAANILRITHDRLYRLEAQPEDHKVTIDFERRTGAYVVRCVTCGEIGWAREESSASTEAYGHWRSGRRLLR
jgi:cell division septum initiation protein DivIVA